MSYAAPFSLLSLHLPDHDESVAERLRWPLAGSALLHAVVFVALLSLRFGSSLEQSSGSYEVTLVTLPEIASSPTASPANKSRPERNADKVPPPKAEDGEAPKVVPQKRAVNPPGSMLQEKPRVPELVTDSLVGALDSVVVPKPQALALSQKAAPLLPPPLPPLPVLADPKPASKQNTDKLPPLPKADDREAPKPELVTDSLVGALDSVVVPKPQAPALPQKVEPVPAPAPRPAPIRQAPTVEMDVQPVQAPPQPPKLVVRKSALPPTPAPSVDLLTPKLKQAVGATSVPKKPEQVSKRVSPAVAPERKQKPDAPKAPEAPAITLPSRAPRLTAVAPPEMRKKEMPLQTVRKSSTVERLKEDIQSVRIPERNHKNKILPPVTQAAPLVSETMPPARAAEARSQSFPKIVPPQAPQLAEIQDPVTSQPTVPVTASEPDTFEEEIAKLEIPEASAFDIGSVSKQMKHDLLGLRVSGFCSQNSVYWENVEKKIDDIHKKYWRNIHRVESPAILTFRVERNGQVRDLAVVRSSGNKRFDSSAQRAVEEAVLLPFPEDMPKSSCPVQHVFKATLNR